MCTRDLLAYRSPDLDAIYPELVASADGSITAADVEKRRQARALQMHKSDQMDAQFQLLMANKKGILARMVTEAVEKNASGLLQELRAKNPLVESVKDAATGTVTTRNIDLMYDGTGMMVDFLQWLDRDVRDDEEDFHLEVLTELKRHPLPNNCTESQLTARIGDFTANHNPLLGRHKLEGEALSRFIIKSLPESLEQSKAAFLSELKRDKAWADGAVERYKARCVANDTKQRREDRSPGLATFSPSVRHSSFKAQIAAACVNEHATGRPRRYVGGDVTQAYTSRASPPCTNDDIYAPRRLTFANSMSVACPSCGYYIHHSTGRAMRAASGIARFTPSSSNRALHAAITTPAFTLKASPMAPPLTLRCTWTTCSSRRTPARGLTPN
jgi:hypothetical protein